MTNSFLKVLMVFTALMGALPAFAGPTKVNQYIYLMNLGHDAETGLKKTPPKSKIEVIRNADVIVDVTYHPGKNTVLKIEVSGGSVEGRSEQDRTVYVKFASPDSARILKDLLTNSNESLVMLYDYYDSSVIVKPDAHIMHPDSLYVWSDKSQSVMKIGDLIGPRRSVEEMTYFHQLLVYLFGRAYVMNRVNFIEQLGKQTQTQSL